MKIEERRQVIKEQFSEVSESGVICELPKTTTNLLVYVDAPVRKRFSLNSKKT